VDQLVRMTLVGLHFPEVQYRPVDQEVLHSQSFLCRLEHQTVQSDLAVRCCLQIQVVPVILLDQESR
jgi:hypothetical protein